MHAICWRYTEKILSVKQEKSRYRARCPSSLRDPRSQRRSRIWRATADIHQLGTPGTLPQPPLHQRMDRSTDGELHSFSLATSKLASYRHSRRKKLHLRLQFTRSLGCSGACTVEMSCLGCSLTDLVNLRHFAGLLRPGAFSPPAHGDRSKMCDRFPDSSAEVARQASRIARVDHFCRSSLIRYEP